MTDENQSLSDADREDAIADRKAARNFRYWFARVITLLLCLIVIFVMFSIVYDAIVNKKNMELDFLGTIFTALGEFLKFILAV